MGRTSLAHEMKGSPAPSTRGSTPVSVSYFVFLLLFYCPGAPHAYYVVQFLWLPPAPQLSPLPFYISHLNLPSNIYRSPPLGAALLVLLAKPLKSQIRSPSSNLALLTLFPPLPLLPLSRTPHQASCAAGDALSVTARNHRTQTRVLGPQV